MISRHKLVPLVAGVATVAALTACSSGGGSSNDAAASASPVQASTAQSASSTPASSTPASSTPASSTPASSTPASSTPASSTPASSTPASSGSAVAAGKKITANLTEFKITLSATTLKAGTYTFEVKNAGSITHALNVGGPGVDDAGTGAMSPGDTKSVTVTLKAGKYDVYCPVGNHKMAGMDETVTVS